MVLVSNDYVQPMLKSVGLGVSIMEIGLFFDESCSRAGRIT